MNTFLVSVLAGVGLFGIIIVGGYLSGRFGRRLDPSDIEAYDNLLRGYWQQSNGGGGTQTKPGFGERPVMHEILQEERSSSERVDSGGEHSWKPVALYVLPKTPSSGPSSPLSRVEPATTPVPALSLNNTTSSPSSPRALEAVFLVAPPAPPSTTLKHQSRFSDEGNTEIDVALGSVRLLVKGGEWEETTAVKAAPVR